MGLKNNGVKIQKIILIIIVIVFIFGTMWFFPKILQLTDAEKRAEFGIWIQSFGIGGLAIMLVLQVVQVVLAVIPGEPVEIIMGVLYGAIGGTVVCLIGTIVGTLIVFWCVKKFGYKFVNKFMDSSAFGKLKFLHNPTKRDIFIGFLFFLPGTPKDVLTYFTPFTGISSLRMIAISTIARIPSVISSAYIGSTIIEGNVWFTVSVFVAVGLISLIGIIIYNKFTDKNNKINDCKNETSIKNDEK